VAYVKSEPAQVNNCEAGKHKMHFHLYSDLHMLIPYDPVIRFLLMGQMQVIVFFFFLLRNITSSMEEWRVPYEWKVSPDIANHPATGNKFYYLSGQKGM
jgi:uncharacterized membrane protein